MGKKPTNLLTKMEFSAGFGRIANPHAAVACSFLLKNLLHLLDALNEKNILLAEVSLPKTGGSETIEFKDQDKNFGRIQQNRRSSFCNSTLISYTETVILIRSSNWKKYTPS